MHKIIEKYIFQILDTISEVKIELTPEQVEALEKGRLAFFEFLYNLPTYIAWLIYWYFLIYMYCIFIVKEPSKWRYIRERGSFVGPQRTAGCWLRTFFELYERVIMCFGLMDDIYEEEQFFLTYWLPYNEYIVNYKDLYCDEDLLRLSRSWKSFYFYGLKDNSSFFFLLYFYSNDKIVTINWLKFFKPIKLNNNLIYEKKFYGWLKFDYLNVLIYLGRHNYNNILAFNYKHSHLEKDKLDMMKYLVLYRRFMVNFDQIVLEEIKDDFSSSSLRGFYLFPEPILPIKERDALGKRWFLFRRREFFFKYFINDLVIKEKIFLSLQMFYWSSDYFLTNEYILKKVCWNFNYKYYGAVSKFLTYDLYDEKIFKKVPVQVFSYDLYMYKFLIEFKKLNRRFLYKKPWLLRHIPRQEIEILQKMDDIEASFVIRKWYPYIQKCQIFEELYLW